MRCGNKIKIKTMETISMEKLSAEALGLIKGGDWILIDGKWYWMENNPPMEEEDGPMP